MTDTTMPVAPVDAVVMRAGGEVVKDYGTHFLRDDTEIRKSDECFGDQREGYSLFRIEPYGRVVVFGGTREWAIRQADEMVKSA